MGLARRLQDRYGLYLRGLVLLSSALDLQVISFDPGNDLPYVLSLPSYTAVTLYHGKLPHRSEGKKVRSEEDRSASSYLLTLPRSRLPNLSPLDRVLQEVEAWALADYLPALAKGRRFPRASPGTLRADWPSTPACDRTWSPAIICGSALRFHPGLAQR